MSATFTNIAKFSYPANDGAPSSRESSAYHEAGHAAVAVLLGVSVDSIRLCPGEDPSGRFRFGVVTREQHDLIPVICAAGLLAETVFDPNTPQTPRRQDELAAARACRGRLDLLFPAARADHMKAAKLEALRLVGEYWPIIAALARELLAKQKFTGAEVEDFVRQRISGHPAAKRRATP